MPLNSRSQLSSRRLASSQADERLVGIIQLSGVTDADLAHVTGRTIGQTNSWRRTAKITRACRQKVVRTLERRLGLEIDEAGYVLSPANNMPVTSFKARRELIDSTSCTDTRRLSQAWHRQRELIMEIETLGEDELEVANRLDRKPYEIGFWQRCARVPNPQIADVAARLRAFRLSESADATRRPYPFSENSTSSGYPVLRVASEYEITSRWLRLITATGLDVKDLAARLNFKPERITAWKTRESVPAQVRPILAEHIGSILGVEIRVDGLVADGAGGWIEWGVPTPSSADQDRSGRLISLERWLEEQIRGKDDPCHMAERAIVAMREAARAVLSVNATRCEADSTTASNGQITRRPGVGKRKRHFTHS